MMMAKRIGVTLIDKKPGQIELAGEFGTKVYYGDGFASTCFDRGRGHRQGDCFLQRQCRW